MDDLTLVDCNDDTGSLQSLVVFEDTAGTTYRIQVGGFGGDHGHLILNGDGFTGPLS